MSEINRIAPKQVLAAYGATGLIPVQEEYTGTLGDKRCACGLSAVYVAKKGSDSFEALESRSGCIDDIVSEEFDLPGSYINGFINGFDGGTCIGGMRELYIAGWEDGKAAWEAVKHLAVSNDEN